MNRYAWMILLAGSFLLGVLAGRYLLQPEAGVSEERKPLYWVAPMDPNFRRDQPGKSPMGMDLIPVYAEAADAPSRSARASRTAR